MLIGPAQVAARIIEAGWLARYHPLRLDAARHAHQSDRRRASLRSSAEPLLAPLFALFYGAGNGILTIARGTLPLALFGPQGFGRSASADLRCRRARPAHWRRWPSGFMVEPWARGALWVSALFSLSALRRLLAAARERNDMSDKPLANVDRSRESRALHLVDRRRAGAGADRRVQPARAAARPTSQRWHLSKTEAGWLVGIFFAAYVVAVPVLVVAHRSRSDALRLCRRRRPDRARRISALPSSPTASGRR